MNACKHKVTQCKHTVTQCKHKVTQCTHKVTQCTHKVTQCKHKVTQCKHKVTQCKHKVKQCKHKVTQCKHKVTQCKHKVTQQPTQGHIANDKPVFFQLRYADMLYMYILCIYTVTHLRCRVTHLHLRNRQWKTPPPFVREMKPPHINYTAIKTSICTPLLA